MIRNVELGIVAVAIVGLLTAVDADTVHLKSGDTVTGSVLRRPNFLEVRTKDGVVKISDQMVSKIDWDSAGPASPKQAALANGGAQKPAAPAAPAFGEWQTKYNLTMNSRINLDFAETPALDCIDFLRDASGLNMVVSPEAAEAAAEAAITFRVTDMKMGSALKWILRMANLHQTVKDETIYITDRPDPQHVLRVYDVRDLLYSKGDPSGDVQFSGTGGGGGGFGGGGGGDEDESTITTRAADLMKLIVTIIAPTSWGYAYISGAGEEDVDLGDFF